MAAPDWANVLPDMACEDVGGKVLFATDEWFAPAQMLLQSAPPVWKEGEFTQYGKWMDGWESRRRRTAGHDWCVIQLGLPGVVRGFLLDTAFFTGNQVPCVSIMGCHVPDILPNHRTKGEMGTCATVEEIAAAELELAKYSSWVELLAETPLKPGYPDSRYHYVQCSTAGTPLADRPITHIRVNYFPDGGVARLRVFGEVAPVAKPGIDLLAVGNGGIALAWSNEHYGVPRNLLLPNPAPDMGNGWETARNPQRPKVLREGPDGQIVFVGRDWAVFRLCARAVPEKVTIDTNHFKGNFPESAVLEGIDDPGLAKVDASEQRKIFMSKEFQWTTLMKRTKMQAHCQRTFPLDGVAPMTHVRLTILPDGGVSRLRLIGTPVGAAPASKM